MMSGLLKTYFEKEEIKDVVDFDSFDKIWCLKDPIDGLIDSFTELDEIDDFEKLMAKERAFLESL